MKDLQEKSLVRSKRAVLMSDRARSCAASQALSFTAVCQQHEAVTTCFLWSYSCIL